VTTLPNSQKEESRKDLDHPFVGDAWRRSKAIGVLDIGELGVKTPLESRKVECRDLIRHVDQVDDLDRRSGWYRDFGFW
jgi:hypothetical protein